MMGVWYCARGDVKRALDIMETARNDSQIDRAIESSSRSIEGLTHRRFYPWTGTRYFDWPNDTYARPWRLWLDSNEIISLSSLVSGGTTIAASDYFLRRSDGSDEPPYTHIEIDLSSTAAFDVGDTHQRNIAGTGVFGHSADEEPAGALAEDLDISETGVDVTDSSLADVGHIIKVDSERMIVTARSMLDTGVNIDVGDSLDQDRSDVAITMSTTTGAPTVGETILIGSERMLVVDVAGSVLTVKRAWDGTVLATHAGGADIYAPRTLTVTRGVLGTTTATHNTAAALVRHVVPGLVRQLCVAESVNSLLQEASGYGRVIGSGPGSIEMPGKGLADLREQVYTAYGRKARIGAV